MATREVQDLTIQQARRDYRALLDTIDQALGSRGYTMPTEMADVLHDLVCAPHYDVHQQSVVKLANDLRLWL